MKIKTDCRVEKAVSSDRDRWALSQPWLDVSAKAMVATDGRILAVVPVEVEEGDLTGHVMKDVMVKARKSALKADRKAESMTLCVGDYADPALVAGANLIFPNYQNAIPKGVASGKNKPNIRVKLDGDLLGRLLAAIGSSKFILELTVEVKEGEVTDVQTPIVVRPSNGDRGPKAPFGILMPMLF